MAKISNFTNDYVGLTNTELADNKEMFGRNDFITPMPNYDLRYFFKSALRPMNLILLLTALACFMGDKALIALIMLIMAVIYTALNFFSNKGISRHAQSMHDISVRKIKAVRNDTLCEIPADTLLPSDIIYLKEGDTVPADCTVLEQNDLTVDEAILTGVHISVIKTAEIDNSGNKLKSNYVYCGSKIVSGEAVCKVFAIGKRTMCVRNENVKICPPLTPTKNQSKLSTLANKVELLSLIPFAICFFILYFIKASANVTDPVIYSASLAISLIPAFVPLIVSTITALNVNTLKKQKKNIINFSSLEKAGDIDVICVDKTGIITSNNLSIAEIYTENKSAFAHISTLACDKNNPSAIDNIILEFCEEVGADVPIIQSNYLLHTFPFNSSEKMSAFVWKIGDNAILSAKGSPEDILHICKLTDTEKLTITAKQEEFAKKGYSVIAVAYKDLPKDRHHLASAISKENGLNFIGLYAINDPPRESITDAVESCKANGMRLMMITGDNPDTALTVATSIGLDTTGGIVSGDEIERLTNSEIAELIEKSNVFARVSPDTKLRIVNILKEMNKKVCIVGETESDVKVIKASDVGICIGENPSEYAKEASDIWLENNSLDEITNTLAFCKKNRSSTLRAFGFAMSMQFALFVSNLFALLFASKSTNVQVEFLPLATLIIEILVFFLSVAIFTNTTGKITKTTGKVTLMSVLTPLINTLVASAVVFLSYKLYLNSAHLDNISTNIDTAFGFARCFGFATLVFVLIAEAFSYATDDLFAIANFIKVIKRPIVWGTLITTLVLLCLIVFVPSIATIFGLTPIAVPSLLLAFVISLIPALVADILKTFRK